MTRASNTAATLLLLAAACVAPAAAQEPGPHTRDAIATLINGVSYGVPTSPAFALLPEQASEVTHITTPADFQTNAASWVDGARLKSGVAFDWRPLASMVGSLEQYRSTSARQVWWRTVLSAGTAPATAGSPDVLLAAGLRLPLIDRGDLRLDRAYVHDIRDVLGDLLDNCTPTILTETTAEAAEKCPGRRKTADSLVRVIQDNAVRKHWNALRFDVGIAGSLRARNGYLRTDSITEDRAGVWIGLSHPLDRRLPAQVTHVLKLSTSRTDSATQERARLVVGSRIRAFPFGRVGQTTGLSVEAAGIWSGHRSEAMNDGWVHVAGVLEIPLPTVGGLLKNQWLGVGYGGDVGRRDGAGTQVTLRYALYANRLLP